MGAVDRARLVQDGVAVNHRVDQLSMVVDGHGGTLIAHKAELNRQEAMVKQLGDDAARLRLEASDQRQVVGDIAMQLNVLARWVRLPWYRKLITKRPF